MHRNVRAVVAAGAERGLTIEPRSFPDGTKTAADAPAESESAFIGYEAAHPALQAHHWPDAPAFNDPRR